MSLVTFVYEKLIEKAKEKLGINDDEENDSDDEDEEQ